MEEEGMESFEKCSYEFNIERIHVYLFNPQIVCMPNG